MNNNLCMGCMKDKGKSEICPFCGYSDDAQFYSSYLAPHTLINERYIIGVVISYNGESVTYLGYDTISDKKVKVTEYFPETLVSRGIDGMTVDVNPGAQIQFKAYMSDFIEIAQKLSRMRTLTCITQVIAICYQNNTVYSVSEYIDGISLKTYLEKRKSMLSWSETSDLLFPLIKTLSMVHEDGLIHRGISIDNIMLSRSGVVKLDGFCISAVRASRTELTAELFPGFSAPEQYSTVSPHGPWTDVYAICAVIYTCLTSKIPPEALIRSAYKELVLPIERNETVPFEASQAIIEGLSLSISQRPQSVEELLSRLGSPMKKSASSVSNDAPTVAIPVQKPTPVKIKQESKPEKGTSRRTVLLTTAITLPILLIILIFTFWFLFGVKKPNVPNDDSSYSSTYFENSNEDSSFEDESSESAEMFKVKDFIGQDYKIVTSDFENQQFYIFGMPEYVFDDEYPEGAIVFQSVSEGTEFEENIRIDFKVSKGSESITIPSFEKKTQADYTKKLDELGIAYTVLYRLDNTYPMGYVVGIDRMVGSKYKKTDGAIEVYVNKAPPATDVD